MSKIVWYLESLLYVVPFLRYQLYNWYEFVWIFESDVGWSGDFNAFLDVFKDEKGKCT